MIKLPEITSVVHKGKCQCAKFSLIFTEFSFSMFFFVQSSFVCKMQVI